MIAKNVTKALSAAFLVTILLLTACSEVKEKKEQVYEGHGISFTIPPGWKVTEDAEQGNVGAMVNVEKQGNDESGLASIAVVDSSHDLQNMVISAHLQTKASFERLGGTFDAQKPVSGTLNGYASVSGAYKALVQDVPHTGVVYAFRQSGKSVLMVMQEADEDHKENAAGMETIKNTIKFTE